MRPAPAGMSQARCKPGTVQVRRSTVQVRCKYGVGMVRVWYRYESHMVQERCKTGAGTVLPKPPKAVVPRSPKQNTIVKPLHAADALLAFSHTYISMCVLVCTCINACVCVRAHAWMHRAGLTIARTQRPRQDSSGCESRNLSRKVLYIAASENEGAAIQPRRTAAMLVIIPSPVFPRDLKTP